MAYAAELFVYTGRGEGAIEIPKDVVRVRIDLSVLVIPDAFALKRKLREVQLHDGIYKIDKYAFQGCTALNGLQLSDGVKSIGIQAFQFCILLNSEVRHLSLQFLDQCSTIVQGFFLWRCQIISF